MENLVSGIAHLKGLRITRSYLTCAHKCVCSGTTWQRMGSVNTPRFCYVRCHVVPEQTYECICPACKYHCLPWDIAFFLHLLESSWSQHYLVLFCQEERTFLQFCIVSLPQRAHASVWKKRFQNFQNWTESEDKFRRQMPKITQILPSGLCSITGSGQRKRA